MDRGMWCADRTTSRGGKALTLVVRERQIEIRCHVFFEALGRQAGVAEITWERAERLLSWYRTKIERIALARYVAGDLCDGVVVIDPDDIPVPADRH